VASPCALFQVICQGKAGFIALSLALPLAALLAVCLIRSHRLALSIVGTVLVIAFIQMHFTLDRTLP